MLKQTRCVLSVMVWIMIVVGVFCAQIAADANVIRQEDDGYQMVNVECVYFDAFGEAHVLDSECYTNVQCGDVIHVKAQTFDGFVYQSNDYLVSTSPEFDIVASDVETIVHLYYAPVSRILTVQHVRVDARNHATDTTDVDYFMLVVGDALDIVLRNYGDYVYVSNSYHLVPTLENTLHGFVMPNEDVLVTVWYQCQ